MGTHICTSPEHCWECLQAALKQAREERDAAIERGKRAMHECSSYFNAWRVWKVRAEAAERDAKAQQARAGQLGKIQDFVDEHFKDGLCLWCGKWESSHGEPPGWQGDHGGARRGMEMEGHKPCWVGVLDNILHPAEALRARSPQSGQEEAPDA